MSSGDVVKKIEQTEETAYRGVYSDSRSVDSLLTYAYKFKGKPYRGGGTGPFAFDCSGFTSFVYKHFGYVLTHNSAAQTNFGVAVSKSDVSPGDLVFFKGGNARSSRIGHVGIASRRNDDGTFSFIHASTSQGVIESRSNERYYAVRYVTARRLIGPGTGKSDVKEESENVEGLMETLASGETVKKSEKTYTVKRGDNLSVIAQRNGCTVSDLKNWNGLRSNRLAVGQKLKLNVSDENAKGIDGEKQQTTTVTYVISDYQTGRRYDKELEELEEKDEPGYHTVGKGESLYTLAVRYGCRVNDIRKWNQLKSTSVYEGQRLRIADPEEVKVARESTREEIKEPEAKEEKVEPIATEGTKQIDKSNASDEETEEITVEKGESLYSIAHRHGVTIDELRMWNGLDGNTIYVGQKLKLNTQQEGKTMDVEEITVEKGESLYSIAHKYGVTIDELKKWNGLEGNAIYVGQKLTLKEVK